MSQSIKRYTDRSITEVKAKEFIYTWKIDNFKSLHPGLGKSVTSKKVSDDKKVVWEIELYPDGYKDCNYCFKDHLAVKVLFDRQSSIEYPTYLLIMYVIDKNEMEHEIHRACTDNILMTNLLTKNYVFDENNGLLPNGNLTLRFKAYFTSEVIPKYNTSICTFYHVYNKSKLSTFINCIRRNFTYFTNDVVYTPKLSSFMESKCNALGSMFNNEKFSDMKIVASGNEFYVYKGILATQSPVFAAMFEHDMKESKENAVYIPDFHQEVVQEMLRFIYIGAVYTLDVMARDLLAIADKYEIEQLKTMCEERLINELNVDTVTSLLILADKYTAATLKRSALECFVFNAKEIIRTHTYKADLNNLLPLLPEILENLVL